MAANNDKKDNGTGFNTDGIKNICSKYKKYIATGAMLILLSVVISTSRAASNSDPKPDGGGAGTVSENDQKEGAQVDAHEEVNELFQEYYRYYADGDTGKIESIAFPITDAEKSYIKLFSEYIEGYDNIKCYTKNGISDDEYIVMVSSEMKFKDIATGIPDLAYFYVRKNEDGKIYIDNAYSQFNQTNKENNTDEDIIALITEFVEQDEDMVALQKDIREEYNKVLEKDEELQTMVTSTLQGAIADWVASFSPSDGENGKADSENGEGNKDNKDKDNKDKDNKDTEETKTAYTKTKVNMREKRSTDSDIIQTLAEGTKVTVYGTSQNGWLKVKSKGKTGFVSEEYIVADKSGSGENKGDTPDTSEQTRTAYAKTKVNMREKRSTDSEIVQTLKAGTKVTIYGTSQDGWFKVKSNGKTGYVSKEYIVSDKSKVEKEDDEPQSSSTKTRTAYAKTKVNMREKRSTDSEIIQTLNAGTKVTIYGTSQDGWFKVKSKGKTGYVSKEYIVSDKSKVEESKRTAYAKTKVNMREKRSTDSEVIKTLKAGTKVMIYGTSKNGWFKVRSGGKYGYVKKEYVVSDKSKVEKEDTVTQQQAPSSPSYYNEGDRITLSDSVNVRAAMSETADRVGLAYKGDVVTVIMSYAEGWTKVSWNGQTGYVKTQFLR